MTSKTRTPGFWWSELLPKRNLILEPTSSELEYWDRILTALESGHDAERTDAETVLLRSGAGAAPIIYQLISSKSAAVQEKTACLLAEVGEVVLEPLCPLASASDGGGSRWAAAVLGKLKDERALPALTRALIVGNPTAGEVIPGFGESGAESICAYVHGLGHGDSREELDRICSPRISRTSHPSPDVWEVLIRIGEPAVCPLSSLLKHDHQEVVRAATEALLRIGRSACEALQAALSDSSIKVRPTILGAFTSHPGPWMVTPLCRMLGDSQGEVAFAASSVLQKLDEEIVKAGTAEAEARTLIPGLCRVLSDDAELLSAREDSSTPASDAELAMYSRRDAAAAVLNHFPLDVVRAELEPEIDPGLCQRLITVMGCGVDSVQEVAYRVIWTLGSLAADQLILTLQCGPDHSSGVNGLSDSHAASLLWLLAQSGDPRAIEVLCESLTSESSKRRGTVFFSAVIQALGEMRDARAVEVIAEFLESIIDAQRLVAAESLGQIGHRSALPALQRLLTPGLMWGDPVIDGNWVGRLFFTRVMTYEFNPEVRKAVKQAISLILQASPEPSNCPIPAMPPSDTGSSNLPRLVE